MLMIASPGPEFLPALAELLTETISTGFLSKENVLAGLTDEKGFAANIAALAEAKAMPNLPVAFGTVSRASSGTLTLQLLQCLTCDHQHDHHDALVRVRRPCSSTARLLSDACHSRRTA